MDPLVAATAAHLGLAIAALAAGLTAIWALLTRNRRERSGQSARGLLALAVALGLFANLALIYLLLAA